MVLASDLLTEPPIVVHPTVSIDEAMEMMRFCRIRHLMVVEDARLVGLLSDRDILLTKSEEDRAGSGMNTKPIPVSQVMTRKVFSISPDTDMQQITDLMLTNRISALPVMADDELYGVVTKTDLLVWYQDLCIRVPSHDYATIKVRDCMQAEVVTLRSDDLIGSAVEKMTRAAIQHLPVIENGRLRGMLSDRDLRRHLGVTVRGGVFCGARCCSERENMTVGKIMTKNPRTVAPEIPVKNTVEIMLSGGFSALPVVTDDCDLVGIITVTDLIRLIGELASVPVV